MALPAKFESMDEVPEPFREMYEHVSGTTGPVQLAETFTDINKLNGALTNERTERASRQRRIDEMTAELHLTKEQLKSFANVDPEKAKEAMAELEELRVEKDRLEQEKLTTEGKYIEAAELKFQRHIQDLEHQLEVVKGERTADSAKYEGLMGKYTQLSIDDKLKQVLQNQHVREELIPHLARTLKDPWRVDGADMTPNAYQEDQPMYGKNSERLTMDEYVTTFLSENPWAVRESVGGGVVQNGHLDSNGTWAIPADRMQSFDQYMQVRDKVLSGEVTLEQPHN